LEKRFVASLSILYSSVCVPKDQLKAISRVYYFAVRDGHMTRMICLDELNVLVR